jgi:hypothetical protein
VKGRCFPLACQVFLQAAHFQADPPTCISGETAGVGDGVRRTAVSPAAGDELSAVCCHAASQASSGVRGGAAVEQGPVAWPRRRVPFGDTESGSTTMGVAVVCQGPTTVRRSSASENVGTSDAGRSPAAARWALTIFAELTARVGGGGRTAALRTATAGELALDGLELRE